MNGKGDKDRSTFTCNFKENFEKIEWKPIQDRKGKVEIKEKRGKKTYVYK